MPDALYRISTNCIALSYLLAFALELARLRWPRTAVRWGAVAAGLAGLVAHSIFLAARHPSPAAAYGGSLGVAWVLAVFSLYGSLHYPRQAWGVFVLPVVLALVGLAFLAASPADPPPFALPDWVAGDRTAGMVHGVLVLLAAVGVSVGAAASVMYLVQAGRLRRKRTLLGGVALPSLERLEAMNRRAVNVSFPLLTVGLLLGVVLLRHGHDFAEHWYELKVLGTLGLWATFAVLLYLRYAAHLPGRRLAWLTLAAFALLLAVLYASHPFAAAAAPPPEEGRP